MDCKLRAQTKPRGRDYKIPIGPVHNTKYAWRGVPSIVYGTFVPFTELLFFPRESAIVGARIFLVGTTEIG